jgi:hypothetical protein
MVGKQVFEVFKGIFAKKYAKCLPISEGVGKQIKEKTHEMNK